MINLPFNSLIKTRPLVFVDAGFSRHVHQVSNQSESVNRKSEERLLFPFIYGPLFHLAIDCRPPGLCLCFQPIFNIILKGCIKNPQSGKQKMHPDRICCRHLGGRIPWENTSDMRCWFWWCCSFWSGFRSSTSPMSIFRT